ncbi:MAG: type II secretion system F family protein [Thaumarchaeota archaeon]|nr:type II secretion system F family protein [Nitrososphaerota archaeon]
MAAESVASAALIASICVPIAVAGAIFVWQPVALLGLIPMVAYLFPEARLKELESQRKEDVESELPFFSILVNVLGGAGVSLNAIFESLSESEIFDAMRQEALIVKRDVAVFGMEPIGSFERIAASHPSRKFGDFLLGYASKVRSGGDVPEYLAGESRAYLRELEEGWTRYSARVGIVGSLMVTLFGVIPLLLLVVGFFSPATSAYTLTVFALVGVPFLGCLLVFLSGRMQPVGEEPLSGKFKVSAAMSLACLASGMLLGLTWLALALGLCVFFGCYGLSVRRQRLQMKQTDEALAPFLKDLMEYKRQEYDLSRSVLAIATHGGHGTALDALVGKLAGQLRMGIPLSEAVVDPKTRLSKVTFFVLAQMGYSGGGTVDTIFQLAQYSTKVTEMKKNAQAEMKPYILLSNLTPLLLVFGVTFVGGVLSSFAPIRGGAAGSGLFVGSGGDLKGLLEVANLLIVTSAAALGIVGAKIADLTVRNTHRALANVLIATTAAALAPSINLPGILHFGA